MQTPADIAQTYLAAWNEADSAKRLILMGGWAENATYQDPVMQAQSRNGIAGMIEKARTQFPGHRFALRGTPDGYGSFARFSWTLASDVGAAAEGGTDIVRLDADGRICAVIGFLDEAAA